MTALYLTGEILSLFHSPRPYHELICIEGAGYFGLSRDFNIDRAWRKTEFIRSCNRALEPQTVYFRDQLLPIFRRYSNDEFTLRNFRKIVKRFGKSNEELLTEVRAFSKQVNSDYITAGNAYAGTIHGQVLQQLGLY